MLKWIMLISFAVVLIGGLVFLLMGLFNWNMIGAIFGGGAGARVLYSIFGIGAAILLTSVLIKAFKSNNKSA